MRKEGSILKRSLVLSLAVAYLFIALTYILFLPKYNLLRNANNYLRTNTHTVLNPSHHTKHTYGSILVLVHQVYRSTIENKRDEFNSGLSEVSLIIASLFIGGVILMGLLQRSGGYLNTHKYANQYAYLNYCTLRI